MRPILSQRDQYQYWRTAAFAFTDDDYNAHTAMVDKKISDLVKAGMDSRRQFGIKASNGQYHWSPARMRQQKELINDLWAKMNADSIPNEGKAVMMGGLGGSGKGFIQKDPQWGLHNYLTINPDDMKEAMAARGMIPKVEGLSPMEASPLVHEESSYLAKKLAERAYQQRKNVLWDITMSGDKSVNSRVQDMRNRGYNQVDGVFMDADANTARERAIMRHRKGEEAFRNGQGYGGRWLPSFASAGNMPSPGSDMRSKNAEVWGRQRPIFDNSLMFNATGPRPVVDSATGPRWGWAMPSMAHQEPALVTAPINPPSQAAPTTMPTAPIKPPTLGPKAAAAPGGDDLPSVRELLGMYERQELSFHQLLATLAAHHFDDTDEDDQDPSTLYDRAESQPGEDAFFWVDSAEDRDVITPEQHQAITEAIERAYHLHPEQP